MTIQAMLCSGSTRVLASLLITAQLAACGGDGGGGNVGSAGTTTGQAAPGSGTGIATSQAAFVRPTLKASQAASAANTLLKTTQAASASATLNWTAPVARADGSPLSLADIKGYRVYYGTTEGDYPYYVDVADGTAVQMTLDQLSVGTYYIVMTTYDVAGRESEFSPVLVKKIQG